MSRLRIDESLCTGNGRCYALFPELFTDDDRGYGQLAGDGRVSDDALAQRAILACPERAIDRAED